MVKFGTRKSGQKVKVSGFSGQIDLGAVNSQVQLAII